MPRIVPTQTLVVMLWLLSSAALHAQDEDLTPQDTPAILPAGGIPGGNLLTPGQPQEPGEVEELAEPEPIDAYHIELILFSRRIPESTPVENEPLYYRRPDGQGFAPGIFNALNGPLFEEVERLVRSPDYEVRAYASWRQVSARAGASPRVLMQSLTPAFTGWLTVYDNNILLSEMDIEFIPDRDRPLMIEPPEIEPVASVIADPTPIPEAVFEFSEQPLDTVPEVVPEPELRYRINERRRVRFNEQHYFDHPRFGVLLRVERAEITVNETLGIIEEDVDELLDEGDTAAGVPPTL